jgi:crossover junction endodeoxyribonuclease RuvC
VDPGCVTTGWGLLGGEPSRPELVEAGWISLGRGELAGRLARLRAELDVLLPRLAPTSAAVELAFHGVNARSALQLAHARGVILAGLGAAGILVAEYTPATIKQSVTGNGRADKQQVRAMVARLLRAELGSSRTDMPDALAVALCHAQCEGFHRRVTPSGRTR